MMSQYTVLLVASSVSVLRLDLSFEISKFRLQRFRGYDNQVLVVRVRALAGLLVDLVEDLLAGGVTILEPCFSSVLGTIARHYRQAISKEFCRSTKV